MNHTQTKKLVFTVKGRCRLCYTCVRECPVKAIKIENGQAEVINEKCIGCGNCIKVCSQGAKVFLDTTNEVLNLIESGKKIVACIAPSFPAEFSEIKDYQLVVGMLRKLGFDKVVEVSFGADIIAKKYKELIDQSKKPHISSDCPAIVSYIEKYHPKIVPSLAPIVSPMVAIAKIIKKKYNNPTIVFIGPCIAKKAESDEVDDVITFKELRDLFRFKEITQYNSVASNFDPPFSGKASIFPVSRGLSQTIDKTDDISEAKLIVTEGSKNFIEIINSFENNELENCNLELLCCEGCIMGPGMSTNGNRYTRRTSISKYVKEKLLHLDKKQWEKDIDNYINLDFSQSFKAEGKLKKTPSEDEIAKVLKSIGKFNKADHLNCGACGYHTCEEHAIAIIEGLAEEEMCLPFSIEKLHNLINDLNISNSNLANAKQALKQSEKLASMGQLSAGIAHELNNPLGVITMYSNILKDEVSDKSPIKDDLKLIVEQADRCKKIVGGLLNFARKNQVKLIETDIISFVKHSLDSIIIPKNITIEFVSEISEPYIMIDTEQMMQVFTNIEKNAIEAMPNGGYLKVSLYGDNDTVEINILDTGTGITKENMKKLFTPFFTTKEIGKGTGLGLPLVYGIIKMHNGQITVKSNTDKTKAQTGTNFKIKIPRSNKNKNHDKQ
jgi:iron only hydrogenase large subunit-like protein/nitrogen-specific signal transduction histidine kinase